MSSRSLSALFLCAVPLVALERYRASEPHMGTVVTITLYASSEEKSLQAFSAAFARIAALDRMFSDYSDTSELSQVCSTDAPLSPEMKRVLTYAEQVAADTNAAFDITVGPLTKLWRNAKRSQIWPDAGAVERARLLVGYRKLQLAGRPRCADLGMRLDAGGIAKGFAADEALATLRGVGIRHALVALSGDIAIGDVPPGTKGWRVEAGERTHVLKNCGVSTSGDQFQFQEHNGRRYSHIIDPRSGTPVVEARTVSVIAPTAMQADALATAANVLGPGASASSKLLKRVRLLWR